MAKMYESPQVTASQFSTEIMGGKAPSMGDVIKSANARSEKRHDVSGSELADVNNLPNSSKTVNNELVGVKNDGYLTKKGLPFGVTAFFNSLPPGMDIADQEITDQRKMAMKTYAGGTSFPGDGWA